jgi:hypothetical protein
MMRHSLILRFVAAMLAFPTGRACAQGVKLEVVKPGAVKQEPVKVGIVMPMTGAFAHAGRQVLADIRLNVQEHGDAIVGRRIQLIVTPPPARWQSVRASPRSATSGLSNPYDAALPFKQTNPRPRSVLKGNFAKPDTNIGGLLGREADEGSHLNRRCSRSAVWVLVLAGIIVNHVLSKRRQPRPTRLQTPSASIQDNRTGQPPALPLCNLQLERAAA